MRHEDIPEHRISDESSRHGPLTSSMTSSLANQPIPYATAAAETILRHSIKATVPKLQIELGLAQRASCYAVIAISAIPDQFLHIGRG